MLEVLVAFTILALSLGVVLQAFSTGLRSEALAQDYSRATLLAESRLAAIGMSEPLQEGERSGQLDERFHWRATVQPIQSVEGEEETATGPPLRLYQVTMEVSWNELYRQRSVALTTWRLAPPE